VLPVPSRTGPEGPPRPFGITPPTGPQAPPTPRGQDAAQTRVLRYGPFPATGLLRGISEGTLLLDRGAAWRQAALGRIRRTGASVVRIPVDWRGLVDPAPPAAFDARDPASPAYHLGPLDEAVSAVVAAGLEPLLVVSHAPAFAEAAPRWPYAYPGSWDPSPQELGAFAAALARRYDGSFPDPSSPGRALPRVRLFQAWNEPNLARYLEPQWVAAGRSWRPFSPLAYRGLLNAFYAGVKSVQPGAVVVAAGIAPTGQPAGEGRVAPVTFLRTLLCLTAGGGRRPLPRHDCATPAHFDVLAFHPLSVGDPDVPASSSLDVAISDAAKVSAVLAAAERAGTALPRGRKPIWVTELNWESAPPSREGVPPRLQARYVSRGLHRLWAAGVTLVAWQFLLDPFPALRAATPTGGLIEYQRPAGLYSAGPAGDPSTAAPKDFLAGFALPFDPLRVDRRRVRVWALADRAGEPLVLERRGGHEWRVLARLRADPHGVLNVLVALRGSATLRLAAGPLLSAAAGLGG
jgi:hypothetical protein